MFVFGSFAPNQREREERWGSNEMQLEKYLVSVSHHGEAAVRASEQLHHCVLEKVCVLKERVRRLLSASLSNQAMSDLKLVHQNVLECPAQTGGHVRFRKQQFQSLHQQVVEI